MKCETEAADVSDRHDLVHRIALGGHDMKSIFRSTCECTRLLKLPPDVMCSAKFEALAGEQVLHLTTVGRVTGRPCEIEIWFILCREKFYLFSEQAEAAGWVKNIRRSPNVSIWIGKRRIKGVAKVLDYRKDRQLWDEVRAIADRKYGWGDGLPVEITPVA